MKRIVQKGLVAIIVALISLSAHAEKRKVTWTTKWGKPQVAVLSPGVFGKDHLLTQWERRDKVTSSDPQWNVSEVVYYEQADEVAASAVVTGYAVLVFKSGDKAYCRLDGSFMGSYKENGAWEGTAAGVCRFVGGTGKYQHIKGTALSRCQGTDTWVAEKETQDTGGCKMEGEVEF